MFRFDEVWFTDVMKTSGFVHHLMPLVLTAVAGGGHKAQGRARSDGAEPHPE